MIIDTLFKVLAAIKWIQTKIDY